MQFEFEGRVFRIGFSHDKPRDWAAHWTHEVIFARINSMRARCFLYCKTCQLQISDVSKALRDRRTHCTIYGLEPGAPQSTPYNNPDWKFIAIASSRPHAKTKNHSAEIFTRDGGRRAALKNALDFLSWAVDGQDSCFCGEGPSVICAAHPVWPDWRLRPFRVAAWAAYNNRARKAATV